MYSQGSFNGSIRALCRVTSRRTLVIIYSIGHTTPLITTHEPPSMSPYRVLIGPL